MKQAHERFEIATPGRGLVAFTREVEAWLGRIDAEDGLCTLFIQHTSASLLIQENADPSARADLERWLTRLVKDGDPLFEHTAEGPDDMPSHVRAALTQTHLTIPVREGALTLGTWQGLYVWEHRLERHRRRVAAHYLGT